MQNIQKKVSAWNVVRLDQQFGSQKSHDSCRQTGQRVSGSGVAKFSISASTVVCLKVSDLDFLALVFSNESGSNWLEASLCVGLRSGSNSLRASKVISAVDLFWVLVALLFGAALVALHREGWNGEQSKEDENDFSELGHYDCQKICIVEGLG